MKQWTEDVPLADLYTEGRRSFDRAWRALDGLHREFDCAVCDDVPSPRPPRWTCSYCNALNPDDLFRCDNCYAPREKED